MYDYEMLLVLTTFGLISSLAFLSLIYTIVLFINPKPIKESFQKLIDKIRNKKG